MARVDTWYVSAMPPNDWPGLTMIERPFTGLAACGGRAPAGPLGCSGAPPVITGAGSPLGPCAQPVRSPPQMKRVAYVPRTPNLVFAMYFEKAAEAVSLNQSLGDLAS